MKASFLVKLISNLSFHSFSLEEREKEGGGGKEENLLLC